MEHPPHRSILIAALIISTIIILALINSSILPSHTSLKARALANVANLIQRSTSQTASVLDAKENLDLKRSRTFNLFLIKPFAKLQVNAPTFTIFKPITPVTQTPTILKSPIVTPVPVITPAATIAPVTPAPAPKVPSLITNLFNPAPKTSIESIINTIPTHETSKADPKKSVVQILCKITEGNTIKNISSSGVLISESGLILTNAHVAIHPFLDQYTDKPITCSARHGSPALNTLPLSLIYISPQWTTRHPGEIHGTLNQDSGESDFAILKTSSIVSHASLLKIPIRTPENTLDFSPHFGNNSANTASNAQTNINNLATDLSIRIFGYPINGNPTSLSLREENLRIEALYGFNDDQNELIETSVSTVGKSGASGGALVDTENHLVGLVANIVNSHDNGLSSNITNQTKVHGISIDHIDRKLKAQTGISLYSLLSTDGNSLKQYFERNYLNQVRGDLR